MTYWTIIIYTTGGLGLGLAAFLLWRLFVRALEEIRRPTRLTLLSANLGNSNVKSVFRGFKLEDDETPVLRENISALNPDIIHLQELAGSEQVDMLLDKDEYITYFEDESCTAVRRGLFSHLDPVDDYAGREGFSVCRAFLEPEKANLYLFNIHTASPLKDGLFKKRGAQIRFLLREAVRLHEAGKKLILAGDFNFDPYRFESFRHKIFETDSRTDLDITREIWTEILDRTEDGPRLVSPDDRTFHFTVSFTIDHIITNINTLECSVLNTDTTRIDVKKPGSPLPFSIPPSNTFETPFQEEEFMDHSALLCRLEFRGNRKSLTSAVLSRIPASISSILHKLQNKNNYTKN